jgi:spore maturation protein CgeB
MSKILYVGDLNTYSRSFFRYRTLIELGHEVQGLPSTPVVNSGKMGRPTFAYRVAWKLKFPFDNVGVNRKIIEALASQIFDFVWIEKGNTIFPFTLKKIKSLAPKTVLLSCAEDDMYASHGHSAWYRLGLKYYDTVFTSKEYNLQELKFFGAKDTKLFLDSYYEKIHHPQELNPHELTKFSCDVSAIGAFEKERANSLLYLAKNGIEVSIWGSSWQDWVGRHPKLIVKNQFLFEAEYAKAISASKVNLNFLRKINRDEVTSRSVEIPACGGFMLAERTRRHQCFFEEGKEADFFSSDEELLKKIRFYLKYESQRIEVAKNGLERCRKSDYSMRAQLTQMLVVAVQK